MEDAMIINKASYERGFAHATVYKTESVSLRNDKRKNKDSPSKYFHNIAEDGKTLFSGLLEPDGLPAVGTKLEKGSPLYCVLDSVTGQHKLNEYKSMESGIVDEVRILGREDSPAAITDISIKIRLNRNPVIGDKFSSRHGQKGVLSQLWPTIDMPFTESGMTPDVIINPHAFPSRMTIGMLIESMSGKSGCIHGIFQDATPFRFSQEKTASAYFGEQLLKAGYNYYGNEPMYSGITGTELRADIFFGVVYYQRLRHMVKDKYQVRATGKINNITHQPIKGRKVGGGIRFGEMERDSLLAHGTSFLLHDRLMNCSDYSKAYICTLCGSILSPISQRPTSFASLSERNIYCRLCDSNIGIEAIAIPFVFRYLAAELAAMNIRCDLSIR